MRKFISLLLIVFLASCSQETNDELAAFEVYCEMVANGAKPIALHKPMNAVDLEEVWPAFEKIAAKYQVEIFREDDFPETPLWPSELTRGKAVAIIYKSPREIQYRQFKEDFPKLDSMAAARRLGRLLGYTNTGINELLMANTDFRTLQSFGIARQTTHLYYSDVEQGRAFYGKVLGLKEVRNSVFQISEDSFIQLNSTSEEHPEGQPKSTAIAFLTNQLPAWYSHVQENSVPIKYSYKPKEGGPHDGFVAIDPEGYLLEFEQFKQHSENELFMAVLETSPRLQTSIADLNFYGSITWTYHNDLLLMQRFYEEELGFMLVADQGWTKIYQTAGSSFVGLVDERRGMMDYADEKAVELQWDLQDSSGVSYFSKRVGWEENNQRYKGPELYWYRIKTSAR